MLLEVNCSLQHFMDFLTAAGNAGVEPDFDMHGADENSVFGLKGVQTEPTYEPTDTFDDIE